MDGNWNKRGQTEGIAQQIMWQEKMSTGKQENRGRDLE